MLTDMLCRTHGRHTHMDGYMGRPLPSDGTAAPASTHVHPCPPMSTPVYTRTIHINSCLHTHHPYLVHGLSLPFGFLRLADLLHQLILQVPATIRAINQTTSIKAIGAITTIRETPAPCGSASSAHLPGTCHQFSNQRDPFKVFRSGLEPGQASNQVRPRTRSGLEPN